jgi:hypothetical protein
MIDMGNNAQVAEAIERSHERAEFLGSGGQKILVAPLLEPTPVPAATKGLCSQVRV